MRACLVLHTDKLETNGLRDFFNALFSDSSVFFGNMFTDKFCSGVSTELLNDVGVFAMSDSEMYEMPVPSRGSLVVSCFDGVISNKDDIDAFVSIQGENYSKDGYYPGKLMVRLNSNRHEDSFSESDANNYAERVKSRVVDKMEGVYSFTLAYLTIAGRSRIIVARKNRGLYFHMAYNNGFYALVWTDEVDVFNMLDSRFFLYSMTPLYANEVLVIHPLYLIDKWKKWRQRYKTQSGVLMAVSVLEKYLERIAR